MHSIDRYAIFKYNRFKGGDISGQKKGSGFVSGVCQIQKS
nr:MAG TPA: hypothetical protein [Caudoviricetes sp.]